MEHDCARKCETFDDFASKCAGRLYLWPDLGDDGHLLIGGQCACGCESDRSFEATPTEWQGFHGGGRQQRSGGRR